MAGEEHRPTLRFSLPEDEGRKRRSRRSQGKPEPDESKLTEEALRGAALRYLDRQDASVEQLRRVLLRRVRRYASVGQEDVARERIEALLVRFQESSLLNDERFAAGMCESLRRRGGSTLRIRSKLKLRGLSDEHVSEALDNAQQQQLDDHSSAIAYAKKRRLLEKYDLTDPAQRNKALAVLARQGFSFDVARKALGF